GSTLCGDAVERHCPWKLHQASESAHSSRQNCSIAGSLSAAHRDDGRCYRRPPSLGTRMVFDPRRLEGSGFLAERICTAPLRVLSHGASLQGTARAGADGSLPNAEATEDRIEHFLRSVVAEDFADRVERESNLPGHHLQRARRRCRERIAEMLGE